MHRLSSIVCSIVVLSAFVASCGENSTPEVPECRLGSPGCACEPDGDCDGSLSCIGAICKASNCSGTTEGCPCGDDDACDVGLTCNENAYCEDPRGREGGACFANRTCDPGLVCGAGNLCVACEFGTAGCACYTNGSCNTNLTCDRGTCASQTGTTIVPPADPQCYTPCRTGFVDAQGAYRACSVDGLMDGCLEGSTCTNGQCLVSGEAPKVCSIDSDCTDFQTCIGGTCYSECDSDSECSSSRRCFRHTCRATCSSDDGCDEGQHCDLVDGEHGYCQANVAPDPAMTRTEVEGSFSLSTQSLRFSNVEPSGTVTITNRSARPLDFVVRKASETTFPATGSTTRTTNAMPWMSLQQQGQAAVTATSITVRIPGNGGSATVTLGNPSVPNSLYEGTVEVSSVELGTQRIHVVYASTPDGRWAGKVYYFTQFGANNLDEWVQDRTNQTQLAAVNNAFIQKWGALRQNRLSLDEFNAVMSATVSEQWRSAQVRTACDQLGADVCFPYSDPPIQIYANDRDTQPVPTGVVELPMAIDIRRTTATTYSGRIASELALHYSGNPSVNLSFVADPATCSLNTGGACLAFMNTFGASIAVGGRYATTSTDRDCSRGPTRTTPQGVVSDFRLQDIPWLVDGFTWGTDVDPETSLRVTHECRDTRQPNTGSTLESVLTANRAFAGANPIPDARSRVRNLALVDGMLVNQDTMLVLFREQFAGSFLGGSSMPFDAYGLMVLSRANARLTDADFIGTNQTEARTYPGNAADTLASASACTPEVFTEIGLDQNSNPATMTIAQRDDLVSRLISGSPSTSAPGGSSYASSAVHYLCHDTGTFDGGRFPSDPKACPAGSTVTYFAFVGTWASNTLSNEPCQTNGTCDDVLANWAANPSYVNGANRVLHMNPVWRCTNANSVYCDSDRYQLKADKTFFTSAQTHQVAVPLLTEIDNAFRYRTQFQSRQGRSIGFAPSICIPNSSQVPYCYDPASIERIRRRVDCLSQVYTSHAATGLGATARNQATDYLKADFWAPATAIGATTQDGFERLYAELLIMQGDDAYTRAFQTRFDLASQSRAAFPGSAIEAGGIDLSGVAGYEMFSLYQASQYYGMVLDRFYSTIPYVWASLDGPPPQDFVTPGTVTDYLDRVLRASVQRSRAMSQIAKRYQALQRPDLARAVVSRGYASAYLESVVIGRLMARIAQDATPETRDQMSEQLRLAGDVYRAALTDMRSIYSRITDDVTVFGFAPDYIPMPPVDPGTTNAFETMLNRAKSSMQLALVREDAALASSRSFDTDAAAFQSELVRIRTTYENQLAQICGTMQGEDGNVYPAIRKYAYLNERARTLGDPCGMMGNGEIHTASAQLEMAALDARSIGNRYTRMDEEMTIELDRVGEQCGLTLTLAQVRATNAGDILDLEQTIRRAKYAQEQVDRVANKIQETALLSKCTISFSGSDCPSAIAGSIVYTVAAVAAEATFATTEIAMGLAQTEISEIQNSEIELIASNQCQSFQADSRARIRQIALDAGQIEIDALKADYAIRLQIANINQLRNQATRIEAESSEQTQLSLDVQAAQNDPNVRIYRNDAVINADDAFERARNDAYRATRVLEYYTSQSYEFRGHLGLVRLVSRGDYNLQNYLADLEDAYFAFQETYGRPDLRVDVLSLRDDVLQIPRYDGSGSQLIERDRTALFRVAMTDSNLLDSRGYLAIPFATTIGRLSPLTRNHKIDHVEVEIVGSNVGSDGVGRVYLTQAGTGVVSNLDASKSYFRFPEVTAVVNPLFNGVRAFEPSVYRNERMRDRPYANTNWVFYLNQRDELANQDIDLGSLSDVRLYVYYTDFTAL